MNFSLRTLAIVLISCAVALCQSKPGSGTGSTGTGSKTTPTNTPTTTLPTRPTPNINPQPQMPIFLSGRVVMDDGTVPSERVSIERVCAGQVVKEGYTDPTAKEGDWCAVDLAPVKTLVRPVTLATLKADKALANLAVVRKPRISVVKILAPELERILELAETRL